MRFLEHKEGLVLYHLGALRKGRLGAGRMLGGVWIVGKRLVRANDRLGAGGDMKTWLYLRRICRVHPEKK